MILFGIPNHQDRLAHKHLKSKGTGLEADWLWIDYLKL